MRICAFCAKPNATITRDHIPPKGLFGQPLPNNLITVPACPECNAGASGDDEYFRLLATEWDASSVGDPAGVAGALIRSMRRPAARRFSQAILASIRRVLVETEAGLLVPAFSMTVSTERLLRTVVRMIRGLHYHVSSEPLPPGSSVQAWVYEQAMAEGPEAVQLVLRDVLPILVEQPEARIGGDIFAYRFARANDHPHCTAWWLEFYRRFHFVGVTIPPGPPEWSPSTPDKLQP